MPIKPVNRILSVFNNLKKFTYYDKKTFSKKHSDEIKDDVDKKVVVLELSDNRGSEYVRYDKFGRDI